MKIAIVGCGFCGLAACWELLQIEGVTVTLFDAKGVGSGASGMAAGLVHPYPGEQGRRSWMADAAMQATLELIAVAESTLGVPVADRSGILRLGKVDQLYDDIIPQGENSYLITSGLTVYSGLYLEGLWQACQKRGAQLILEKIERLDQLKEYDQIILTVGAGIFAFEECRHLKLGKTKGQVLTCKLESSLERSIVAKGYLAKAEVPGQFYLGSTYEKGALSDAPCLDVALAELKPKMEILAPDWGPLNVLECKAGVRVSRAGHYIPLLEKINDRCHAITAMGSRGLLYHAYFAKLLSLSLS